ncbi:hypothetical protein E1258_11015 [Micromonospora sp. KC207]|nr:hypothetical protein E1258_11015 [Micromonospora sp. KC207]
MGFGTHARKVRDRSWPYGRRTSALLLSCVRLYRPIGFHATLGILEEMAGPYQQDQDEDALLRALDALAASEPEWLFARLVRRGQAGGPLRAEALESRPPSRLDGVI